MRLGSRSAMRGGCGLARLRVSQRRRLLCQQESQIKPGPIDV